MCVPAAKLRANLVDPDLSVSLAIVYKALSVLVSDQGIREEIKGAIGKEASDECGVCAGSSDGAEKEQALLDLEASAFGEECAEHRRAALMEARASRFSVRLDAALHIIITAWTEHRDAAIAADQARLLQICYSVDEKYASTRPIRDA